MTPKQMLTAGAIAGSMVLGAGTGALLFTPALSSAQDTTTTTTESENDLAPRHGNGLGVDLDVVAKAIGITTEQLRTELQDGKTIAAVATAHDVDPQKVIDAVVAAATKRLDAAVASGDLTQARADELKANLEDHATRLVNETRPPGGPGHHQFRANEDSSSTADGAAYAVS